MAGVKAGERNGIACVAGTITGIFFFCIILFFQFFNLFSIIVDAKKTAAQAPVRNDQYALYL